MFTGPVARVLLESVEVQFAGADTLEPYLHAAAQTLVVQAHN